MAVRTKIDRFRHSARTAFRPSVPWRKRLLSAIYGVPPRAPRGVRRLAAYRFRQAVHNDRQFHAKYPLQVKARLAKATATKPKTPPEPEVPAAEEATAPEATSAEASDPVAIRRLLLDLAKELASAESKAEVIEVMARLDDYVAEIMEVARD